MGRIPPQCLPATKSLQKGLAKKKCVQNSVATKFYAQNGSASNLFLQKVWQPDSSNKILPTKQSGNQVLLTIWQRVYAPCFFYHRKQGPDPFTVHIKSVGVIARIQQLFFRQPNFRYKTKFGHPLSMLVKMRRGENEKMWRWTNGKMWGCGDVKMWKWEDVKMRKCENVKMWGWEGVKTRKCEDEKMWKCEDVRVTRCEKMWEL